MPSLLCLNSMKCIEIKTSKNWIDTQFNWVKLQCCLLSKFQWLPLFSKPLQINYFSCYWNALSLWYHFDLFLFTFLLAFSLDLFFIFSLWLCIAVLQDLRFFINFPFSLRFFSSVFHQLFNLHCFFLSTSRQSWCIVMYCPIKFIYCPTLNENWCW